MTNAPSVPRTVVFGGINMDLFIEAERFPKPGETFEGQRFYIGGGGKGANQAIAAARLAGPGRVDMVGRVGDDVFGNDLLQSFDQNAVGRRHVQVAAGESSGIALIFIDGRKENYVLPVYGANATCGQQQLDSLETVLRTGDLLLVQQEIPRGVTADAMRLARDRGATVVLDPAPVRDLPDDFVALADIVVPNQLEVEALTGVTVVDQRDAAKAAARLRQLGPQCAIVKLGAGGCFVNSEGVCGHFAGFEVTPVATVAAGDAFAGGLAVALAEGREMADAVCFANAAGALSVTKHGAQESMPFRAEVDQLLKGGAR